MKRFWLLALLLAGTLVSLQTPAFAQDNSGSNDSSSSDDVTDSLQDINSALGTMASQINDINEKFGLKFFGDVRVRYAVWTQSQSYTGAAPTNTTYSITDKAVGRYRARFGAMETFGDVTGAMRIATGSNTNPNSQNNTFDNGFADPSVNIDLAYLKYKPSYLNDQVELTVGKMPNPLFAKNPNMWDPDINPEGAALDLGSGDTQLVATYFDLVNTAGTSQNEVSVSGGVTTPTYVNTQAASDEYMADVQLEQILHLNSDAKLGLTLGYEYVPNATALAGGSFTTGYLGPLAALSTSNTPVNSGNIFDYGKTIPNFEIGEVQVVINHHIGDVPMQWTADVTDNFNSFNVPVKETESAGPTGTKAVNGYTDWGNNLGLYLEAKAGDTHQGDFQGVLAYSYVQPNAQLANLASDDAGFTNTAYLFEQAGYGLEKNVSLLLSLWQIQRIYYSYLGAPNNKLVGSNIGGTSQDPMWQVYADAVLSF